MRLSLTYRLWGLHVPVKSSINRKGKMKQLLLSLVVLLFAAGIATGIPNPAAVYCVEQGYEYEIRYTPEGQYGVCVFPDGSSCSAWQYYCGCEPEGITCSPGGDYDCHWPCEGLPCKQAGESVLVGHCCPGLSEIPPPYVYDEQCNFTGMTGWTYVCSDCGNGICETWESRCNCIQDCGDIEWIISECPVEVDELEVHGVVIVTHTGCLIVHDRSHIDGDQAHLIIDGGSVLVNARFDMGQGEDAYLIVKDGGSFTQTGDSDGLKLPDDDGGVHRIIIRNVGTVHCDRIELIPDRDAEVHIGWGVTLIVDHALGGPTYRYNPEEWLEFGWLVPIDGVTLEDITITWDGDQATVTTPLLLENWATKPSPEDGATGVRSAVTEVVLSWSPGTGVYGTVKGRHFVYFGTDFNDVNDAPTYEFGWTPPDCYMGWLPASVTMYNVGNLPLWTPHYWRIDEGPETGGVVKGFVWRFTTGCPLIVGDLNLDCLLNAEDYAILMTTWKEKQYFPWD